MNIVTNVAITEHNFLTISWGLHNQHYYVHTIELNCDTVSVSSTLADKSC